MSVLCRTANGGPKAVYTHHGKHQSRPWYYQIRHLQMHTCIETMILSSTNLNEIEAKRTSQECSDYTCTVLVLHCTLNWTPLKESLIIAILTTCLWYSYIPSDLLFLNSMTGLCRCWHMEKYLGSFSTHLLND